MTIRNGLTQLTDHEYHSDTECITSTQVKTAAEDMQLYRHRYVDGHKQEKTAAMTLGSAIHAQLAGSYDREFACFDGVRRGKDWQAFKDANSDREIVTKKEHDNAERAAHAVRQSAVWQYFKLDSTGDPYREACVAWQYDDETRCKCKPDIFLPVELVLIDFKTVSQFSERKIKRQFWDLKYHLQAAHYIKGIASLLGINTSELMMIFLYVETSAPYRTAAIKIDEIDQAASCLHHDRIMQKIKTAKAENQYETKFSQSITTIDLPLWVFQQHEDQNQ